MTRSRREQLLERFPELGTRMWPDRGFGRWMKRRLSKARRKLAQEELRAEIEDDRVHERSIPYIEGECDWKGW